MQSRVLTWTQSPDKAFVVTSQLLAVTEFDYASTASPPMISDRPTRVVRIQGFKTTRAIRTGAHYDAANLTEFRFKILIGQWHRERGATSSITKMAMCPAYQRIIAMGEDVVPLILRQMESEGDEPDMWFWALHVLTGADPVPEDASGNIVRMANAWLDWARSRYVW